MDILRRMEKLTVKNAIINAVHAKKVHPIANNAKARIERLILRFAPVKKVTMTMANMKIAGGAIPQSVRLVKDQPQNALSVILH